MILGQERGCAWDILLEGNVALKQMLFFFFFKRGVSKIQSEEKVLQRGRISQVRSEK